METKNIGSYDSAMKATNKHHKENLKAVEVTLKILNLIDNYKIK